MKKKLLVSTMALAAVAVVAVATEPIASVGVNNTVVANEVSASMIVNPVGVGDTILSGTGVANDNLTIQNLATGQFYSAVVAADGTWSVPVDAAVEGQKFLVTSNSLPFTNPKKTVPVVVAPAEGSKPEETKPEETKPEETKPEETVSFDVYDVKAGSVVVSGKGVAGESVSVVAQLPNNATKNYSAVVDADGNWSVSVDAAEGGTIYTAIGSVTQTNVSKAVDGVKPTPEAGTPEAVKPEAEKPEAEKPETTVVFNVYDVKAGSVVLSGKGAAGESVSVVAQLPNKSTKSYSAVVDADGNWSVAIDKAEAGTVYTAIGSVTQTYVSKAVDGVKPQPNVPSSSNKNDSSKDANKTSSSKSSSSKSSSTKASSSATSSSSKASSSEKGSKESKSTDAAVNDAKKAAKPAKEGQKVLPNTAAVK
ncbi:LPKTxAVK-anchored surface protein [Streptococcus sp. NLN64]|uniref:LPKTxAVK-anchored surface protein n=1 Tax=Streptococcus sp. NLN64 TaxID=2822799 RepID=UPI0018CA0120|nr:LPKTxAVK-anchored surface protein [Streptococcus sp. NLN64]MBG9367049.1 hypothetical protein [Streptococcus sp. NLN64]